MWKEFKAFAMKGNVIDMAVGIVIGVAFGKIITSLVNDIIMPPLGLLLGRLDFSNLFVNISGQPLKGLAEAKALGAATINYGVFLNTIIDFIVVALAIFIVIKQINRFKAKSQPAAPNTKECGFCFTSIPIKATRCPNCTSELTAKA